MAILLGPPEIYNSTHSHNASSSSSTVNVTSSDPFMDQMVANFNEIHIPKDDDYPPVISSVDDDFFHIVPDNEIQIPAPRQNMGLTENNSPTFISSGGPCLDDCFFHIVPDNEIQIPAPPQDMGFTENNSPTFISSGDPCLDDFSFHIVPDNEIQIPAPRQIMGFTENNSPTFISSGDPCLDFFFHIVPDTPSYSLIQRLHLAWSHNPLTTLKLVCNLRGVRGTGKSDKEGFYAAALWLYTNHPRTLSINVPSFAEFGFFKDLPEILYRILEGLDVRKLQKDEWLRRKESIMNYFHRKPRSRNDKKALFKKSSIPTRQEKRIAMAKKVIQRYQEDDIFRLLYDHISDHFAECLKKDLEFLKRGELRKISLAAKWCPSIDSSFDRSTLLCESIARRIFPRESYQGVEEAHYAYRIRDRLRKEILVPLRKALELPEVYIGANQWGSIPYNRVASVAMQFYGEKFLKHDEERFRKYLADVKSGKSTIAAGALLPHQIIASLNYGCDEDDEEQVDEEQVAELQWKRMVDDLLKKGKLRSSLAICDVSGSMSGIPMDVSVAMGLLVSETSEKPWKRKVITFSEKPKLHVIKGKDLKSKVWSVRKMEWGMNTDFQKVFDVILKVAVNGKLKKEQMIKRVFVFSDMEFDEASLNPWETDYEAIKRKFREKGYGSAVPQIVFWNLRNSSSTPVARNQDGVALVSGFSKNLLKVFLDNDGAINPQAVMEAAICGKEYDKLLVLD